MFRLGLAGACVCRSCVLWCANRPVSDQVVCAPMVEPAHSSFAGWLAPFAARRRACGCRRCKWSTATSQWCAAVGSIGLMGRGRRCQQPQQHVATQWQHALPRWLLWQHTPWQEEQTRCPLAPVCARRGAATRLAGGVQSFLDSQGPASFATVAQFPQALETTPCRCHLAQEADALVGQKAVPSMKNATVDAFKKLTLQVGAAQGRVRGRGAAAA